jgi:hypothetical protein
MPKRGIYDVRFVTKDGPDAYFAKLTADEVQQLMERLVEYTAAGEITDPEVKLIDEAIAVSMSQMKEILEGRFGVLEKGRPDVSKVEERFDSETEGIVRDLLSGAFEGGSNYWYRIESKKFPPGSKYEDFKEEGRMQPLRPDGSADYYHWSQLIPTFPGGQLVIRDISEDEGEALVLDLPALKKAWILLKGKYQKIYKRVIDQSWDASDADVFLQLALFDDVIYG